jgi:hypothetical protein
MLVITCNCDSFLFPSQSPSTLRSGQGGSQAAIEPARRDSEGANQSGHSLPLGRKDEWEVSISPVIKIAIEFQNDELELVAAKQS